MTARLPRNGAAPMTGALGIVDGAIGAPAIKFTNASTTGIYKTTTGLGVTASGSLVAEFTAAGLTVSQPLTLSAAGTFTGDLTMSGAVSFTSTSHVRAPVGTTAQEPAAGTNGRMRFNSTDSVFKGDDGTAWRTIITDVNAASTAEVAAETTGEKYVRADRAKHHPGAAKAWARVNLSASSAGLVDGYNIASVTRNNTGIVTLTFTTPMAGMTFVGIAQANDAGHVYSANVRAPTSASNFVVDVFNAASGVLADINFSVVIFGDI